MERKDKGEVRGKASFPVWAGGWLVVWFTEIKEGQATCQERSFGYIDFEVFVRNPVTWCRPSAMWAESPWDSPGQRHIRLGAVAVETLGLKQREGGLPGREEGGAKRQEGPGLSLETPTVFLSTFCFDIISDLQKSSKAIANISHILFT